MTTNDTTTDLTTPMSTAVTASPMRSGTRTDVAVTWVVWHFGELTGVVLPLVLAVLFTPWFAVVSAVVAAGWAAHEVRVARHQKAALGSGTPPRSATDTATTAAATTAAGTEDRETTA